MLVTHLRHMLRKSSLGRTYSLDVDVGNTSKYEYLKALADRVYMTFSQRGRTRTVTGLTAAGDVLLARLEDESRIWAVTDTLKARGSAQDDGIADIDDVISEVEARL